VKIILIEARSLTNELSIADFAGATSWFERFMRRNGLCVLTENAVARILPDLYEKDDASSEKNRADDFNGNDDNCWDSIINKLYYGC
jgi:hypothetical protein